MLFCNGRRFHKRLDGLNKARYDLKNLVGVVSYPITFPFWNTNDLLIEIQHVEQMVSDEDASQLFY